MNKIRIDAGSLFNAFLAVALIAVLISIIFNRYLSTIVNYDFINTIVSLLLFLVFFMQLRYLKGQKEIMEKQIAISERQGQLMALQASISERQDNMYKPSLRVFYTGDPQIGINVDKNAIILIITLVVLNASLRNNIITEIKAKIPSHTYFMQRKHSIGERYLIESDSMRELDLRIELTTDISFKLDSTFQRVKDESEKVDLTVSDMHENKYELSVYDIGHTQGLYQYFSELNRL